MKTKNVMLGGLALLLALGSALASSLLPGPVYVRAKPTINSSIMSIYVYDVACDDTGAYTCRVQLSVTVGADITSNTYRNSAATLPAVDTDPMQTPKVSSISVYQLF